MFNREGSFDFAAAVWKGVRHMALVVCLAFGWIAIPMVLEPATQIAWADDDDDDDDGDDDDGDDDDRGSGGRGDTGGSFGNRGERSSNGTARPNLIQRLLRPRETREPQRQARPSRPSPPLPDFAPAEIVALGLTDASVGVLEASGYTVLQRDQIGLTNALITRLQVPAGVSLDEARIAVEAVQPGSETDFNHFYRPGEGAPCRELWCTAPNLIDWPDPKANDACVADVKIGLVDTGINADHEALKGSDVTVLTSDAETRTASSRQHGTAVAAILAGSQESRTPGLLPRSEILAIDAFHRGNRGDDRSDVYTLVRSLDRLAESGAQIINMSLAGSANTLLENMVATLNERGVLLVAAAGNAGPRSAPAFPAAYDGVFAVTAVDSRKRIYRRAGRGAHIDFAAPGVEVWTAASIRGARTRTGTSFATPFVTAALAMLRSSDPSLTGYADVKARLTSIVEDLGEPGFDEVFGHGLLRTTGLCNAATDATAADRS